jgi:hypothetical protein
MKTDLPTWHLHFKYYIQMLYQARIYEQHMIGFVTKNNSWSKGSNVSVLKTNFIIFFR